MSSRHLARSIAMQTLFEWDFSPKNEESLARALEHILSEFGEGIEDTSYITETVTTVVSKQKIIDEIITKAAPEWPLEKISAVDRNILRLGLCELIFGDRENIPPKVAINEAIELAKAFGGENSGRFINGVLGAVYKEMGEPGKDDTPKKKKVEVDPSTFPVEEKGGAVVYSIDERNVIRFAMVHDVFGYWTLSKGTIEPGETPEQGTIREVKEEIGLDITIIEKLGENEYIAHHPEKGKTRKRVHYFLAQAPYRADLQLETESGGLDNAGWFEMSEIGDLTMYEDVTQFIAQSLQKIIARQS